MNISIKKVKPYAISIGIALIVGILSALFTRDNMDIYEEIVTPPLSPPSIVFPIVWSILYVLMGISAAMIYTEENNLLQNRNHALITYGISLIVNFFWSIIFFNMKAYLFAFIWLVLLWALVLKTIIEYFSINRVAAWLQIPYLLWVSFAGYLNFSIWLLNK